MVKLFRHYTHFKLESNGKFGTGEVEHLKVLTLNSAKRTYLLYIYGLWREHLALC